MRPKKKTWNQKANTNHEAITKKSQSIKAIPSFGPRLFHTGLLWRWEGENRVSDWPYMPHLFPVFTFKRVQQCTFLGKKMRSESELRVTVQQTERQNQHRAREPGCCEMGADVSRAGMTRRVSRERCPLQAGEQLCSRARESRECKDCWTGTAIAHP